MSLTKLTYENGRIMEGYNKTRREHSLDIYAIIIAFVALCISAITTYRQFFYEDRSIMLYVVPSVSGDGIVITANLVNAGFGADVFLERIDVVKYFDLESDDQGGVMIVPATFLSSGRENSYSVDIPLMFEIGNKVDVGYKYIENICRFYEGVSNHGRGNWLPNDLVDFLASSSGTDAHISINLVVTFRVKGDLYVKDVEVISSSLTRVYEDSIDASMWAVGAVDLFDLESPDGILFADPPPDESEIFEKAMAAREEARAKRSALMPRHLIGYSIYDDGKIEFRDISHLFVSLYRQSWNRKFWDPNPKDMLIHVKEHCDSSKNKE